MSVSVISDLSLEAAGRLSGAFGELGKYTVDEVALDAEGVDLSRMGDISIVQIATLEHCFILDVLGKGDNDPLIAWLRGILEDTSVSKIIHDCRMDSDAFLHHLKIKLTNVHDTACWHKVIARQPDKNLNDTLMANGLQPNTVRDKGVYNANHRFWATRPLTPAMIEWASGDLSSLFELRKKQVESSSERAKEQAAKDSTYYAEFARSAKVDVFTIRRNVGRFIGKGGSEIRALQARTNTIIYSKGPRGSNQFMVYYVSADSLARVQKAARDA